MNSITKTIQKGELLLRTGDIATYGYKVISGCLKSYVLDKAGKEHILQFAPEEWIISDLDSLTNQIPSLIFIEACENSEVLMLPKSSYEEPNTLDSNILIDHTIKFRNNLIATNKRIIGLLSATAEKRYNDFTEIYPTLVQRLPQKLIASYISITPQYLSEIKAKIAKEQ